MSASLYGGASASPELLVKLDSSQRRAVVTPAWRREDVAELRANTGSATNVDGDRDELVHADLQQIERVDVFRQTVGDAISLGLERAEQSIPDDEDAAVVAIEVLD